MNEHILGRKWWQHILMYNTSICPEETRPATSVSLSYGIPTQTVNVEDAKPSEPFINFVLTFVPCMII